MMRIAICDDEKMQRTALSDILIPYLELCGIGHLIDEYSCGEALLTGHENFHYEMIFLDIEMPGMDGLQTAKKLRSADSQSILIFVTAYPDFVFQGYEVHAFRYILKPYEKQKILDVTALAIQEMDLREYDYWSLPQGSGSFRLNLRDTLYFYSEKRIVTAVSRTGSKSFYSKLDDIEKELPGYFCRVHQRYLVNLNHVTETRDNMVVIGPETIPVSRAHKQKFLISFAKTMLRQG